MLLGPFDARGSGLYDAQLYTQGFLKAAITCDRLDLIAELAALLVLPFQRLEMRRYTSIYEHDREYATWDVSKLTVAQYLYEVAVLLRAIAALPPEEIRGHPSLERAVQVADLAFDHYRNWILYDPRYSHHSLGCPGEYTHWELLLAKDDPRFYDAPGAQRRCRLFTDLDLFIVAGLVEMLAAHREAPELFELEPTERRDLHRYLDDALRGIARRVHLHRVEDFDDRPVDAADFEPGLLSRSDEHVYAGYRGESFPKEKDRRPVPGVGWDISHARRFVDVFDTLHRHRDVTGQSFPDEQVMRAFANQFAYVIFNGDLEKPLFTNFFDGSNGWYRVNYAGREKFGYAPYDLSYVGLVGGYGFWARYNPDIERVNEALLRMVLADVKSAPELVEHRERFYGRYWRGGVRRTALDLRVETSWMLLQFFPVFAGQPPQTTAP